MQEFPLSNYFSQRQTSLITLGRGDFLFQEGDKRKFVHILDFGGMSIIKNGQMMWRIRENEFVCISAFFNKEKHYPYGAKATRPSTVIRITQKEFTKVIYRHPELRIILTDLLCSRITSRQNLTEISLKLSPKQRIIHFLIANSKPTSDNGIPEMDFNTSNFAAQIYTTPKLVNRVLHKLMDNNLVDIKGDRLMILDLTGLTRILNMKVIMDSL